MDWNSHKGQICSNKGVFLEMGCVPRSKNCISWELKKGSAPATLININQMVLLWIENVLCSLSPVGNTWPHLILPEQAAWSQLHHWMWAQGPQPLCIFTGPSASLHPLRYVTSLALDRVLLSAFPDSSPLSDPWTGEGWKVPLSPGSVISSDWLSGTPLGCTPSSDVLAYAWVCTLVK